MRRKLRMLSVAATLGLCLLAAGCATTGLSDAQELALYRAHAGPPVKDLRYADRLTSWTALGDDAIAIWTRPNQAYLLELDGCKGLGSATTILITNLMGQVSAGFDRVQVINRPSGFNITCRIQTIRPLEVKALRASQKALREAQMVERDAAQAPAPTGG